MEPDGAREATILEGRLHPATIVLMTGRIARGLVPVLVVGLVRVARGDESALVVYGGMTAVALAFSVAVAVVMWARFRWRLTNEALEVTSGILGSSVRRIPLSRIQDLGFKAGVIQRALGVVAVLVETSSTAKAEAELDVISQKDADALALALGRATASTRARPTGAAHPAHDDDAAIVRVATTDLVKRGLTDNRAGLVIAAALTFFERMAGPGDAGVVALFRALHARVTPALGGGIVAELLFACTVVGAIWALGYVASVVFNLLTFHGFTLRLENDVFVRQHGLFTRERQSLPRRRIQGLRMRQSWLRRAIGIASLEAHDMGGSADAGAQQKTGTDVFVPVASVDRIRALFPLVFPDFDEGALRLRAVSPRMVRRTTTAGALIGAAAAITLVALSDGMSVGARALALLAVPIGSVLAWPYGRAAHGRLRFASTGAFLAIRRGVLGREEILVPAARMQSIAVARTPLDRFHGVATLEVVLGGGERVRLANVPWDEARALAEELALAAEPHRPAAAEELALAPAS